MVNGRWRRLRILLSLGLFATSAGGAQLLDAIVFHSGPVRVDVARFNAGDHCHSERCELGAPIVSPPPITPPAHGGRVEPPGRDVAAPAPADAPRGEAPAGPLGSRAPPLHS
jgi:hypothetical protein